MAQRLLSIILKEGFNQAAHDKIAKSISKVAGVAGVNFLFPEEKDDPDLGRLLTAQLETGAKSKRVITEIEKIDGVEAAQVPAYRRPAIPKRE